MDVVVDLRRTSWGQWEASAIVIGTSDPAIDGPTTDTKDAAIAGLKDILPAGTNWMGIIEHHNHD